MDIKVGVEAVFFRDGQIHPTSIVFKGGEVKKIEFVKAKNVVYHAVADDGKHYLLSYDIQTMKWYLRDME